MRLAPPIIFVVAFTIRVSLVLVRHDYLHPPADESVRIARSLNETGVFGNPWIVPTGATAQIAPFQPFLISLSFRLFGDGPRGELARFIVGCIASSLVYAMLPAAAVSLGLPLAAGIMAGGAGALLPLKYFTEVSGAWESPWAALAMILLISRAAIRLRSPTISPWSALLDGVFWGVAILISPSLLPVLFGLIVMEGSHFSRSNLASYLPFLALRLAIVGVLLVPWTVRNYQMFGAFCPVRCSFGLELFTGNNPQAHVTQSDNFWSGAPHPTVNPAECARLIELGETGYNREKLHAALDWIVAQPKHFLYFTAMRVLLFWFSWTPSMAINLANWMLTALGLAGLILLIRTRNPAAALILATWIMFPLVYYVMQASTKYRYPMDWSLLLLAGYTASSVFRKVFGARER
jgi:hypothetical protein